MLAPEVFYYYLNLIFSFLVAVLLFSPVVIGYVIRRRWRLAAVRKEEIKRLLVLASEEAARAELEASSGYTDTVSAPAVFQCAVCYFPTTTRCARCKSVRYCSGKCQIIHWRRGHKEECHPPSSSYQIIDNGSNPSSKAASQDHSRSKGNHSDTENVQLTKPVETTHKETTFSNSSHDPEFLYEKDDAIKDEVPSDVNGTSSFSSRSSFSAGFYLSATTSELSDNVSVSDGIGSNDPKKLDAYQAVDIVPDIDVTATSLKPSQTKPLSAELNSFVDVVYSSSSSNKSNQLKPDCSDGETRHGSTSSSGLSSNESSSIGESLTASNGFWKGALDSNWPRKDAHADPSDFIPKEAGTDASKVSDFGSQSSLHFSFNLSGSTIPHLRPQGSGINSTVLDDTHTADLGKNKVTNGVALSNNIKLDAPKVEELQSSRSQRSIHIEDDTVTDTRPLRSKEVSSSSSASFAHLSCNAGQESTSTNALKASCISFPLSRSSNHFVNGTSASNFLKLKDHRTPSSSASDCPLSSSDVGNSVQSVKTGKVDHVHSTDSIPPQTASTSSIASNGLKTSMKKVADQFKVSKLSKNYSLGVGSVSAGRYSDKGLFPYELFIKLYSWNKVELLPCGLTNCGNSCYANVVLQCLAFTQPLNAYLLQGFHSKACVNKDWCFTCEFESLILKVKEGNSPLSPLGILSQLRNIGSHLGNGREEDAHEFLRYIIDKMQSVCLKEAEANTSGSMIEETTLIGLTFGGYLQSKIKCMKCLGKSERHERIMDLTVEIEGDIGTLDEALQKFTSTEMLDGENKYHCSRCKSYEKAKKKLKIFEAPNVLTIALKRFQSGKFGKLSKSIEFPEILDLAKYMSGTSDKSPIYKLYGVVVHLDVMNAAFSGHYVCYVKNNRNRWFKIDDSMVKAVEFKKVKEKGAYMLFYARYSPRAPRLLRNRVSRDAKIKVAMAKSGFPWAIPNIVQSHPSSIPLDGPSPSSSEFIYPRRPMRTIFEADSSSDSSSLFSSCSDEGSCSTESNRDSTSTDDLSDYIFGDAGHGWASPWRNSSDSDTSSSSSSPLYGRHSPLADLDRYASSAPDTSRSQTDYAVSTLEGDGPRTRIADGSSRLEDLEGKGSTTFFHSNMSKQCRKLASSSCRETDSERIGRINLFENVKFSASFRRSTKEKKTS